MLMMRDFSGGETSISARSPLIPTPQHQLPTAAAAAATPTASALRATAAPLSAAVSSSAAAVAATSRPLGPPPNATHTRDHQDDVHRHQKGHKLAVVTAAAAAAAAQRLKRLSAKAQKEVYSTVQTTEGVKFRCAVCSRVFNLKCTLLRHVRHQHEGRYVPHPCDLCGQVFKRTDHLKVHMRKIHKVVFSVSSLKKEDPDDPDGDVDAEADVDVDVDAASPAAEAEGRLGPFGGFAGAPSSAAAAAAEASGVGFGSRASTSEARNVTIKRGDEEDPEDDEGGEEEDEEESPLSSQDDELSPPQSVVTDHDPRSPLTPVPAAAAATRSTAIVASGMASDGDGEASGSN